MESPYTRHDALDRYLREHHSASREHGTGTGS